MDTILLLYEPKSDAAVLSWGSFRAALPLANVADPRLWKVARTTDLALTSTRLRVSLPQPEEFSAVVLGPMNVTTAYLFRVRAYTSSTFVTPSYDSGWIQPFIGVGGSLVWGDPNWWIQTPPWEDTEHGIYLVHVLTTPTTSTWWSFELDDGLNSAGFIDIGRLFMATAWAPSINYAPEGNGLSFLDNSRRAARLDGGEEIKRRINPREFAFAFPMLPQSEGYADAYRLQRIAGYDGEVFVIPDATDTPNIQSRSFMGRLSRMDPLAQANVDLIGTAFTVKETI